MAILTVLADTASPTNQTPGGIYGGIAVLITAATGAIVALTALFKAIKRGHAATPPPAPIPKGVVGDDETHAERAWKETLEQLDAANDRADRADVRAASADANAREWMNKYVKLLEERKK